MAVNEKALQLYNWIYKQRQRGHSPTLPEMSHAMRLMAVSSIQQRLRNLKGAGWLKVVDGEYVCLYPPSRCIEDVLLPVSVAKKVELLEGEDMAGAIARIVSEYVSENEDWEW